MKRPPPSLSGKKGVEKEEWGVKKTQGGYKKSKEVGFKNDGPASKCRNFTDKSPSRPSCSHSDTIYDVQLQKISITHAAPPWCSHYKKFAASRRKPASLDAHGSTTWRHSCGHSTAIYHPRFQITLELRIHKHSQSSLTPQFHCGNKKKTSAKMIQPAPTAHTRCLSSSAAATLHGKTKGFVPQISPKTKPIQHPHIH